MVRTLHNMYLRDTNHNLHSDNNDLCSLCNKVPWRIWSSKWRRKTFNSKRIFATNPEIELTLCRIRKVRKRVVNNSSSSSSVINSDQFPTDNSVSSFSHFTEAGQMENNDRTLKELATPDVVYQHWCIQYPQLEPAQTYELKSGLIHLLPKFHGLVGEDPHKHLKEFHVVYSTMRP
ncbi:hypothetical protein CR513_36995, partial [Mucuna pruriens]